MTKLVAGQKLLLVLTERRHTQTHEVTVERVGRRWAYIDRGNYRIDVKSWYVDNNGYDHNPGRCYESREAWERDVEEKRVWSEFQLKIRNMYAKPRGATASDITEAARLLGLTL